MSHVRSYEFPYEPVPTSAGDDDGVGLDLVVATTGAVDPEAIAGVLTEMCSPTAVRRVVTCAPVYWTQVRTERPHPRSDVDAVLRRAGIPVRYVASARRQSLLVPPPTDVEGAPAPRAVDWAVPASREVPPERMTDGRWFLRDEPGGLAVDRAVCGHGRGTRLAVIDDDAADLDLVDLDATVLVGTEDAPRASGHGALLVGWAVGARTHEGSLFAGVAPGASVRAYLIPRPGDDVLSLPAAIVRAAADGADVILCATYVEGSTSPMLDDALDLASRLGRGRLGCVVVLPTGREASSPRGSVHASLSLSLGDPASDPRVLCVAPGGRKGGWFLWREQHGRLRPFANRGPAVRCLSPGDDLAYPFLANERLFHAESSGASALAAGVALLVVSCNPWLRADEVLTLLARTSTPAEPLGAETLGALADRADALPAGCDADGHDAKHGYGRIHALRACLSASDPVALELVAMGEVAAARGWVTARKGDADLVSAYSQSLGCWMVRALLADHSLEHALRTLLRHLRLLASEPRRVEAHPVGVLGRPIALLLRKLESCEPAPTRVQRRDLRALAEAARESTTAAPDARPALEAHLLAVARALFGLAAEQAAPPARPDDDAAGAESVH
jgi:hypothetical protein